MRGAKIYWIFMTLAYLILTWNLEKVIPLQPTRKLWSFPVKNTVAVMINL